MEDTTMKKIKLLLVLIILSAIVGCNENRIYEVHDENFPLYRWDKNYSVEFSPEIQDISPKYNIFLNFRYVYGFQFEEVKVNVEFITPSGISSQSNYTLKVLINNDYQGDCAGDYCDLETLIKDKYEFPETGKYKIIVKHLGAIDPLLNVMEVGLIIDKIE